MQFLSKLHLLFAIVFACLAQAIIAEKPWDSVPRSEEWWHRRHLGFVNTTASLQDWIKVVFIGSSLIEWWSREGLRLWNKHFAQIGAVNYGIAGDQTQHLLWRIDDGELDGLNPKLVVLYIGSNNVPDNPNNDEIVQGVNEVVNRIHEKLPNSNILLVGTFSRAETEPVPHILRRIRDIGDKLINLVGWDWRRRSHYLDLFWHLAPPSMDGIYTDLYNPDKLHLNRQGYKMWQREMNDIFQMLIR